MTIDEIRQVVSVQLGVVDVRPRSRIVEDLGAESADVVNIIASLVDKYRVTIGEEKIAEIETVADLYDLELSLI